MTPALALTVVALFVALGFLVHAFTVSRKLHRYTDKPSSPLPPRALLRMSDNERLDEQRSLITDGAETFAVEFVARLTRVANMDTHKKTMSELFATLVERELRKWLPLGGRIRILPITTGTSTCTMHCIAYLEVREEVDAHEVSAAVCQRVLESEKDYDQVVFFPVVQSARLRSGHKPGLWVTTTVTDTTPRKHSHVVSRTEGSSAPEQATVENSYVSEWESAREELLRVTDQFAEFEFSPMDVALTRRLLWDLTEPATARFYEAYDAANILLTSSPPKDTRVAADFVEASRVAVTAWEAADRNARDKAEQNIGSGGEIFTAERVKHRDTAASALALALDPSSTDAEAGTAWRTSMEALDRAGLPVPSSRIEKLKSTDSVSRALRALTAGEG